MGTADEIALDMLINSLDTFSQECETAGRVRVTGLLTRRVRRYCGLVQLVVGGLNEDWQEGTDEMEQLGLAPIDRLLAGAPVDGFDASDDAEEMRLAKEEGRRAAEERRRRRERAEQQE